MSEYGKVIRTSELLKQLCSITLLLLLILFVIMKITESHNFFIGCGVASEKITQLCATYPEHSACAEGVQIGAMP